MIVTYLIAIALLLIVEVLSQMVWTLCLAIGCIFALGAHWLGVALPWQLCIMAIATVVAYIVLVPRVRRWHQRQVEKEGRKGRTGMEALLGRRAVVTNEIRPGQIGRARIDGDYWQVVVPGVDTIIPRGAEVTVTSYDSIILTATLDRSINS